MIRVRTELYRSLWLIKVLTLIFLGNISQPGLSQHLTGPRLPLPLPLRLGLVRRGTGSISWRYRESRREEKESRTFQELGAENSQASPPASIPITNTHPTLSPLSFLAGNREALCCVLGPLETTGEAQILGSDPTFTTDELCASGTVI